MASHGQTLDSLNRLQLLIQHHRDELPELYIAFGSHGRLINIQVTEFAGTWTERRVAVKKLANLCGIDRPRHSISSDGSAIYTADAPDWHIYTVQHLSEGG